MVKRTRFRRHPVHNYGGLMLGSEQEYGGIVQLDTRDAAILTAAGVNDISWSLLSLAAALPPAAAVAAILDVEVNDASSSTEDTHMRIARPGIIIDGRTHYIHCGHINDQIGSKIVIVEMSDDCKIAYLVQASGAQFDYDIKLIGWILHAETIDPKVVGWVPSVRRIPMPSENLKAIFVVNQ